MYVFMIFMHNVIHSTCGCTNSMFLSISIVVVGEDLLGSEYLDHRIVQEMLKYTII